MNHLATFVEKWRQLWASWYVRIGVGGILSILACVWVFSQVEISEVIPLLRNASIGYLFLGVMSVCLNVFAKVIRWKVLLGEKGQQVAFHTLGGVMMSSQLVNAMIPGRVGDVGRILTVGQTSGKAFVLGTVILEKWVDTIAFAFLFLIVLFWIPLPGWLEGSVWGLMSVVMVGSLTLIAAVYYADSLPYFVSAFLNRFPTQIQNWVKTRSARGLSSLQALRATPAWLGTVGWTVVIWVTAVLNNYAGMRALNVQLPLSVAVVLLMGLQVGIVVTASPGALGVFEYICMMTLTFWGVERSLALGVGLVLHLLVYLPLLVGGFWPLLRWGIPSLEKRVEG